MVEIAVMGYGVVGSGVVEVLYKNKKNIEKKIGDTVEVKYILDLRDFPDSEFAGKFTKSFDAILDDKDISVVVEVMGGIEPSYSYVKACLEAGKSVCTSNKELVAARGAQLLKIAKEHNVNFFFEASVGGGIPIIRPLHQSLAADEIDEIAGILNGTTNFILTKMFHDNMAFDDALKLAQQLGYAERNPSADVDGHDACRKICILASLCFSSHVYPDHVHTEGITDISKEDVQYAEDWGGVIKLIGRAKRTENGKVFAMVSPAFIHNESQLASVADVFNAILVRGDSTGEVVFYGKGAGKLPTASAVVADVIDAAKANGTVSSLHWEDSDGNNLSEVGDSSVAFYLRVRNAQQSQLESLFDGVRMLSRDNQPAEEKAFITPVMKETKMEGLAAALEAAGVEILSKIRVLDY